MKTKILKVTVNQVCYSSRLLRITKKLLTSVKNDFIISYSFSSSNLSFQSKCFVSLVWLVDGCPEVLSLIKNATWFTKSKKLNGSQCRGQFLIEKILSEWS